MKKRILATLLAAALIISLLPAIAFADDSAKPAYQAAYGAAVKADGVLSEADWLMDGYLSDGTRFGVLWDSENVYVAAQAAGELSVSLNGQSVSAQPAVGDGAVEAQIPMDSVGLAVTDYSVTAPLYISLGEGSWEGDLCFSSLVREDYDLSYTIELTKMYNITATDSANLGGEKVTGGFRMYNRYLEDGMNSAEARVCSGTANVAVAPLADRRTTITLEYDFVADAMPEYENYTASRSYICYGFSMALTSDTKEGYIAGITNTADGLLYCVRGANGDVAIPMNKTIGEQFHIRQDWNLDGSLDVYVDGTLIGSVENAELTADTMKGYGWGNANVVIFNLRADNRQLESDADNVDITYSNLTFGKAALDSALDGLDFNAIKGENTDAASVGSNLALPDSWSNGQLASQEIVWESSHPDVVAADGTVTPAVEDTVVTLTASLKSNPEISTSIEVTVRQMTVESLFTEAAVTVDGVRGEAWPANRVLNVRSAANAPYAGLASMWYQEKLYFFINYAYDVNTVKLSLADKSWTVDLSQSAVSNGALTGVVTASTVELCLDLKAAGLKLLDYGQSYSFQVEMEGDSGTASLEAVPIQLAFVISGSSSTVIDAYYPNAALKPTATWTLNGTTLTYESTGVVTRDYFFSEILSDLIHTKDVQFDQTITVESMPVSAGEIVSRLFIEGYSIDLGAAATGGRSGQDLLVTSVYNSGDEGLKLRVLLGSTAQHAYSGAVDITLGKNLGETFKLGLRWNADNTLVVYVDGVEKGVVENATVWSSGLMSECVNLSYIGRTAQADDAHKLVVSDMTLTLCQSYYTSIKEEITKEGLLGDMDLENVSENLDLPQSFYSDYLGELPLTWVSTDESIIDSQGNVTRPAGTVGKYVDLTLYVGEQKLWTAYTYVLPETIIVPQSPTTLGAAFSGEEVVIDGATTDEGWSMNTKLLTEAGDQLGRLGAQWDVQNLYLAIETGGEALTVILNGKEITMPAAVNGIVEAAIALSDLGVVADEYGKQITASVTLGEASWEGTIVLTSTDWFGTDSTAPRPPAPLTGAGMIQGVGADNPTANQGVTKLEDGWQFFDNYDPEGTNPSNIRSYAIWMGYTDATKEYFAPFADRSVATFVEFDLCIDAMPEYTLGEATGWDNRWACYGFSWLLTNEADSTNYTDSIAVGIYNSADGLVFVALSDKTETVLLNRNVGDLFRIGTRWETDGSITVFLDGEKLAAFENMTVSRRAMGNTALNLNMIRGAAAAESRNDNMKVTVTNIAMGKAYGDKLIDGLTFDTIKGENTDPYGIQSNLSLPTALENAQLSTDYTISWSCSDPDIISADGTVTKPETGKLVTLTATASNGDTKEFELYVVGLNPDTDVLYVENDMDTANGAGQIAQFYKFTLDGANNSVIRDLGESQTVNVIALNDADSVNRLNESVLTIWVSDDNVTYTRVDSFKLLRTDGTVYLYDFEATGRYIKVHCTHYSAAEADFTAPLQTMIDAYYEDIFGDNEGTFTETAVTVTNDGTATKYDAVWTLDLEAQRVLLDGQLLYHYVEGGKTYVRIPELAAGQTVTLTVLSGNADAMDISNKEYTLEVVYGTREVLDISDMYARWVEALPDGTLINVQSIDEDDDGYSNNYIGYNFSYDGGLTWTDVQSTGITYEHCVTVAGIMYDPDCGEMGRIIVQGFSWPNYSGNNGNLSDCRTRFIYSDDLGKTWYASEKEMTFEGEASNYYLSYTAPYKISAADGETGEGIDYVMPLAAQPCSDTTGSFVGRIAYSCDCGLTWTVSESVLSYTGEGWYAYEVGVSEGTILETADGVLVYYGRCQFESMNYFAMSFSYDNGVTWTEAEESSVYTVNTQPLFEKMGELDLLTWAGNTVLGGNSYKRYPLNVAYSTDGLKTFENIQNLWSRYSLQGLTEGDNLDVTNQSVTSYDDILVITWGGHLMKVDSFNDYFFRTKGAYDSFETSSTKYEGWSTTVGSVIRSDEQSTDGDYSMKIVDGASAVRSIPYIQDGMISFDLYLDDLSGTLQIELESAYSDVFGEAAPIALEIAEGKLCGLELKEGWNTVSFALSLTEGAASINVNGKTAALEPDLAIGDYICYVEIGYGTTVCYVDAFTVIDEDPQEVPEANCNHILEQQGTEPSCTEDGTEIHWVCTKCGKLFADAKGEEEIAQATVIPATGHSLTKVEAVDTTYDAEGTKEHYVCEACGKAFWDAEGTDEITDLNETVIPALEKEEDPADPSAPDSGEDSKPGDTAMLIPALIMLLIAAAAIGMMTFRKRSWIR